MAKISSCFQLCPLIDQKSFLGVSDDCDSGHIIVTLGRNIVIRYRLSDQKQVNSWSAKVRLSSPVVFDRKSKQYVGLFNTNTIQMWGMSDVDLSKVKKYKFKDSIHCILSTNGTSGAYSATRDITPLVIVFKDGRVAPLTPTTLVNRKHIEVMCPGVDPVIDVNKSEGDCVGRGSNSSIEDVHMLILDDNIIVILITVNAQSTVSTCHLIPLQPDLFHPISFVLSDRASSDTGSRRLAGYAFIGGDTLKLFTLWSDGSLHCLELYLSNLQEINTVFPGEEIMNVSLINTRLKVALLPLDNVGCNIAVYGSDPGEEGALLVIINVRHKLVQCKYNFKLYCTSPKLWFGGPTDLLLIVGQHLAVAHYRLVKQKLAALVGTQQNDISAGPVYALAWQNGKGGEYAERNENDHHSIMEVYKKIHTKSDDKPFNIGIHDYGYNSVAIDNNKVMHLDKQVSSLLADGLSEAGVFERLVAALIDKSRTAELSWLFGLYDDIPFNCLLLAINYCLNGVSDQTISGDKAVSVLRNKQNEKDGLLRILLQKSIVPDSKTLLSVRKDISLPMSVKLIQRLVEFMCECPCDMRLIDWATLLLDSFYQSFIISKDNEMINIIKQLSVSIDNQITHLRTWQQIAPFMRMIKTGKGAPKFAQLSREDGLSYSLENLSFD